MISENQKPTYKTIFIASDHAGFEMKQHLIGKFPFLPWKDLGTSTPEAVDYPDFAEKLVTSLKTAIEESMGVLVCGSGQGMAIKANRYDFIRAALCWDVEIAKGARQHNNANVLCLAGRHTPMTTAELILNTFLNTAFEGGRHQRRVDKLKC